MDLPSKAVGRDPQLFMVKLHWKPEKAMDSVPLYPKKRRTFNRLVDTTMRPRGVKTISLNEITVKVDSNFFLGHGGLSELGYRQVWKSLSEAICDYDTLGYQKQIDFVSKNTQINQYTSNDSDVDFNQDTDYQLRRKKFTKHRSGRQKWHHKQKEHYSSAKYFDF